MRPVLERAGFSHSHGEHSAKGAIFIPAHGVALSVQRPIGLP